MQTQPSLDNNSVDMDRERAAFVDNAVRYEATLRFINGQSKTLLAAITGQLPWASGASLSCQPTWVEALRPAWPI